MKCTKNDQKQGKNDQIDSKYTDIDPQIILQQESHNNHKKYLTFDRIVLQANSYRNV